MDAAVGWARERGLHGVSLETQDNNLVACRFYLKYGFRLGGADCLVYDAFEAVRNEIALYFYYILKDEGMGGL
jgi:streptothricin acetyltransferase